MYRDVVIAIDQIPVELVMRFNEDSEQDQINSDDDFEEDDNPLDELRIGSTETMLIATIPYSIEEENVNKIAPGENKKPISMLMDQYCEEFAFPYLLPRGHFGYNVERDTQLSASKYFNQRLLNYTQRFASVPGYILFAHSVLQQKQLTSNINMTMKKIHSFIWVIDAPKLTKETKDEYVLFVDKIIKASIPDPIQNPKLHKMVKTFQLHSHSKSCRKYKNVPCIFIW